MVRYTETGLFGGWNSLFLLYGRIARLRHLLRNNAAIKEFSNHHSARKLKSSTEIDAVLQNELRALKVKRTSIFESNR